MSGKRLATFVASLTALLTLLIAVMVQVAAQPVMHFIQGSAINTCSPLAHDQWNPTFNPYFIYSGTTITTPSGGSGNFNTALGAFCHSTGKWYFELSTANSGANHTMGIVTTADTPITVRLGGNDSGCIAEGGNCGVGAPAASGCNPTLSNRCYNLLFNAVGSNVIMPTGNPGAPDIIGFAVDLDSRVVYMRDYTLQPLYWCGASATCGTASTSTTNPSTVITGFGFGTGVMYIGITLTGNSNGATMYPHTGRPPSGFQDWSP